MYIPIEKTGTYQNPKPNKYTPKKFAFLNTHIKSNAIISLIHNLLLCLLCISAGWFITSLANDLSGSVAYADRYFHFLSDSDKYGLFYRLSYLIRRDAVTLLLIFVSSLTFFHNALCTCLLGLNGIMYGICARIALMSSSLHSANLYLYETLAVLIIFIISVFLTSKSNKEFISIKNGQTVKKPKNGIYISREFKRLIIRMIFILIIYIAVKTIFCFAYAK